LKAKRMAEFQSQIDINLKIDNFDGPLDLLLYLIKEAKIDIKDIFVSQVTEQFLLYIEDLSSLDMDKASEFLSVAAQILEIKSRAILPRAEEVQDDSEQDLIQQLETYKLFKEASEKLKPFDNPDRFYKIGDETKENISIVFTDFSSDALVDAFYKLLLKADAMQRAQDEPKEILKDVYTVGEKIVIIQKKLKDEQTVRFIDLFGQYFTVNEVVVTFMALLELLKTQYLTAKQSEIYGDITLVLKDNKDNEKAN